MEAFEIPRAILIGAGATMLVDVWNMGLRRTLGIRSLEYRFLGRWLCHMPEGVFWHQNIAGAREKPGEHWIGWIAHYSIGIMLALAFVFIAGKNWMAEPALLPALLYGMGTVVFPLLVMQPALGLGFASSKTPSPIRARVKSLGTHTVFGIGLWVWAMVWDAAVRVHR